MERQVLDKATRFRKCLLQVLSSIRSKPEEIVINPAIVRRLKKTSA